jgi:hypothetical protein
MNTLPSYTLEVRAVAERKRLQVDIEGLRAQVLQKVSRNKTQLHNGLSVLKKIMASLLVLLAYASVRQVFRAGKRL